MKVVDRLREEPDATGAKSGCLPHHMGNSYYHIVKACLLVACVRLLGSWLLGWVRW